VTVGDQLHKELDVVVRKVNKVMNNTLVRGTSFVTSRAAVDTGRYRAGWNPSINRPLTAKPTIRKKPKGHIKGQDLYGLKPRHIMFNIAKDKSIVLSNNVEYARYVDARYGDVAATRAVMEHALRKGLVAIR
jgi:hypothetical protein